jgi:hypothetical protein
MYWSIVINWSNQWSISWWSNWSQKNRHEDGIICSPDFLCRLGCRGLIYRGRKIMFFFNFFFQKKILTFYIISPTVFIGKRWISANFKVDRFIFKMVYLVECSVVCVKSCEQFSFFSKSSLRWAKLPRENEVAPDYGNYNCIIYTNKKIILFKITLEHI